MSPDLVLALLCFAVVVVIFWVLFGVRPRLSEWEWPEATDDERARVKHRTGTRQHG